MLFMKHIILVGITVVFLCTGFSGCKAKGKSEAELSGEIGKEASYALGMNFGSSLKEGSIDPDWDEFLQGMKDVLYDNNPRYSMEEANRIFYEAYNEYNEKRDAAAKQAGIDFLEQNKQKPGIITTESGLQYEVLSTGDGPKPLPEDTVRVHYKGTLLNGTEFDSSYSRGEPAEFPLNGVISGWTEGLQLMNVGAKYRLFIPSDLGYGSQDRRPQIPPNSTLIFEVELLEINPELTGGQP
jgi:FKBP-type peptidyl-prolyl cis-trans isomerase